MKIPNKEECLQLLRENNTPENVIKHTTAVQAYALQLCDELIAKGTQVNKELVAAAAILHDIEKVKPDHEVAGGDLIESKGYPEVAATMRTHGLRRVTEEQYYPKTVEQKIVFYADKRTKNTEHVSVEERFRDIEARYGKLSHLQEELRITKQIEKELLS